MPIPPTETQPADRNAEIQALKYEEALEALEAAVAALETGKQSLEESIRLYERGQALARHCAQLLNEAELKMQALADLDHAASPNPEPGEYDETQ